MRLPDCSKLAINRKNGNDIKICWHDVIVKFFLTLFVCLLKFSYWYKFHLDIITSSGVMTIYFVRDWPEIQKLKIPPSEFCPISGDWGRLEIPNLVGMFLMKCYWMLQNARVTAFRISDLLRGNQQRGIRSPRLGLNKSLFVSDKN